MKGARGKRCILCNSIYIIPKQAKMISSGSCRIAGVYYHLAGGVRKPAELLEVSPVLPWAVFKWMHTHVKIHWIEHSRHAIYCMYFMPRFKKTNKPRWRPLSQDVVPQKTHHFLGISLNLPINSKVLKDYPHSMGEEAKAPGGSGPSPRSHSWKGAGQGLQPQPTKLQSSGSHPAHTCGLPAHPG